MNIYLITGNENKIREQKKLEQALQEPENNNIIKEAKKEIKKISKKIMSKKDFLDSIFGGSVFNFQMRMMDVIDELEDNDKLERFLSMSKAKKEKLLLRQFNKSMSLSKLISLI